MKANGLNVLIFNIDLRVCTTKGGIPCDIPFVYQGHHYDSCIRVDNSEIPWCYTNTTNKEWGECSTTSCSNIQSKLPRFIL